MMYDKESDADEENEVPDERGYGGSVKFNKAQADYGLGQPFRRCGVCSFYRATRCKIVQGKIDPMGLCEYFKCSDEGYEDRGARSEKDTDEKRWVSDNGDYSTGTV